jgi:hypothetical protein
MKKFAESLSYVIYNQAGLSKICVSLSSYASYASFSFLESHYDVSCSSCASCVSFLFCASYEHLKDLVNCMVWKVLAQHERLVADRVLGHPTSARASVAAEDHHHLTRILPYDPWAQDGDFAQVALADAYHDVPYDADHDLDLLEQDAVWVEICDSSYDRKAASLRDYDA